MGIIFSDKQIKTTVGELLNRPDGKIILNRLQAGRDILPNGINAPHRLSDEDFNTLRDEVVYYEVTDDCVYARFEKSASQIRDILGLPIQSDNPFELF